MIKPVATHNNPYGDDKVIAACSIFGVIDTSGKTFPGTDVVTAIANMHDRSNGLGGGFAVYGLYPEMADHYAFHIMYMTADAKRQVEALLKESFKIVKSEEVPTRKTERISNPPLVWRYFLDVAGNGDHPEADFVMEKVMAINCGVQDAFVFSSGKNMGVFKGVGYPEDIAHYFRLDDYLGYLWTAHGRFPTNTPGWWGGAHPFNILDWTVVHNGEISSYGINRRHLEMFGYQCTLQTDTEVVAYAVDLLMRRHNLPLEIAVKVLAPPLWSQIEREKDGTRALQIALRQVYGSLLLNGPFAVIIARTGQMIGLTDRIRLRPLVAGSKGSCLYLSSEESAIRLVCPDLENSWIPVGGEPIVGTVGKPIATTKSEAAVMARDH
ncbi:MAG: glutamine amidotransferase family protein [Dehalococcoidia bacterium]|nr:glutamine amidotransferase family protein [Dehalococcoidia bacterium]